MDYAINRNNNNDDEEECVIVKSGLYKNDDNYNPLVDTTFHVICQNAFRKYGYDNFIPALIQNENVQSIHCLPVNLALYFESLDLNGTKFVNRYKAPLLKFLRNSKSLQCIKLDGTFTRPIHFSSSDAAKYDDSGKEYLRQIVQAVTHNTRINEIDMGNAQVFAPQIITSFVGATATPHIKSFSVRMWDFYGYTAADSIDLIVSAFRTNRTLETLAMFHVAAAEADNVALVLLALSGHPTIRVLKLRALCSTFQYSPLMAAVASFVGGTSSLEHLWLKQYSFVRDDVSLLLDNLSAAKLTMTMCELDAPSVMKLASYARASSSSSLKELELGPYVARDESLFPIYRDIMMGPSSLQVLDLSSVYCSVNVTELFMALGASTDNICRLPCLHLGNICPTDWRDLAFHLPTQIYLRELRVGSVPTGNEATYFIRKIPQNGSLHRVFLTSSDRESDDVLLDESQIQVLKSVCTRNRKIVNVLRTQYDGWNEGSSSSSHEEKSRRSRSLIPSLLRSVCAIPRTGPNMIFVGLLSCNVPVGLRNGSKRLRTTSTR